MTDEEMKVWLQYWLSSKQDGMVLLLQQLVDIDSYSHDQTGVTKVVQAAFDFLNGQGIHAKLIQECDSLALKATVGNPSNPAVFLTGHLDTVFESGTVAKRAFKIHNGRAYGPGVADMKSGIVMNIFILLAMQELDQRLEQGLPFAVTLFATTDEEIGSPNGRHLIERHLPGALAVFNAEPGRVSGNLVSARKGGASYQIDVTGKAAHAGVSHADGISSIEALARIIVQTHLLTDYTQGITTNIGVIQGGTTPNTVAEFASAKLDVRFMTLEQGLQIQAKLEAILLEHGVEGAQVSLTQLANFLPFEVKMSDALLRLVKAEAEVLDLVIDGEFTGGCSDAGWTASMGIPTLCGTGPVGAYMHTDREYCLVDTFIERATLVARTAVEVAVQSKIDGFRIA